MTNDNSLERYREKWREAPQGSDVDGRAFSTDLLQLPDSALLAKWNDMAARRDASELGWVGPLYRDYFRGRSVIELGSGLGFDGLRFASSGATWTFADIVPDNLQLIARIARLKGIEGRTRFHLIPDDLSFAGVEKTFDAVWVCGSIHHVPFDLARREAQNLLPHLPEGGRWIELVYPKERWLREGAIPFEKWGALTDGVRTPWAEWHDAEKIRSRLAPARWRTVLDFGFCADNYRWVDLERLQGDSAIAPSIDLVATTELGQQRRFWAKTNGWRGTLPAGFFASPRAVGLAAFKPTGDAMTALDVRVFAGVIGIGFADSQGQWLPGAMAIVKAAEDPQLITLRGLGGVAPAELRICNMHAGRRSEYEVLAAHFRP